MNSENISNITQMDIESQNQEAMQPQQAKTPRAMILGAIAAGAFTSAAAATLVLHNIDPEAEPITPIEFKEAIDSAVPAEEMDIDAPIEATVATDYYDIDFEANQEVASQRVAEPVPSADHEYTLAEPKLESEVVISNDEGDILIEEIDPIDESVENVFYVDDIGVMYNEEGEAINAASIQYEGENLTLVDLDNDYVYESVYDGNDIQKFNSPGPINVSDAEIMLSEQTDDSGYLPANDYDNSINDLDSDLTTDMLDDIMLS